jgi:leader peptidase (prepilin peptidase)/N-methyltransferase
MSDGSLLVAGAPTPVSDRLLRSPSAVAPFVVAVVVLAVATLPVDRALTAAFVAGVLVVLSAIDIERGIIPNRIVLPAAAVTLVAQVTLFPTRVSEWVLAAVLAALLFGLPHIFRRSWMGLGDAKLLLLIGAVVGWDVSRAVLIAFVLVFPVAVTVLVRHGIAGRKATIPFGPFLSLGALIVLFAPQLAGLPGS